MQNKWMRPEAAPTEFDGDNRIVTALIMVEWSVDRHKPMNRS